MLSTYYVLNALHVLHHFSLVSNLLEWCCYPHFKDEEIEASVSVINLSKVMQLLGDTSSLALSSP